MSINIKNWKIRTKLVFSFFLTILMFGGVIFYLISEVNNLAKLQDVGAGRYEDTGHIQNIETRSVELYVIFADTIINQNYAESKKDFEEAKTQALKDIETVHKLVDTDKEKEDAKEFEKYYKQYLDKYDELEKALKTDGGELTAEIRQLDGEVDKIRSSMDRHIMQISASLAEESKEGDRVFDATISEMIRYSMIIVAIGIIISLLMAFFVISSINGGIRKILDQFKDLINDILDGNLKSRGDVDKADIDFKDIVTQTNVLIEAFVEPLNVNSEYLDLISKGDLPEKITKEYKGDFKDIMNNLNSLIDSMNEITNAMVEISNGSFDVKVKARSDHDELMPAINNVIDVLTSITEQFNKLADAADNGNLDFRGEADLFKGAYMNIVGIVNRMLDNISEPWNVISDYVNKISKGEIPVGITAVYKGDFEEMKSNINQMIDNLSSFAKNIQTVSAQVATGSEQMSSSSEEMSQSAQEQASSVEEVSSSMEEMNSSVTQNADNARETASIAEKAAIDASEGGKSVIETVEAMKSIAEKISIIEDIARQTNMLALNAAIEAARAGEHGKGFAVVADEVRNLAGRSGDAAGEISDLSVKSVEIAEKAGKLIEDIVPQIQKTAELVQEINAASTEQASGIEQVTGAIEQVDKGVQQNASATEEMSATCETLTTQADELQGIAGFFKIEGSNADNYGADKKTSSRLIKKDLSSENKLASGNTGGDGKSTGISLDMSSDEDKHFEKY